MPLKLFSQFNQQLLQDAAQGGTLAAQIQGQQLNAGLGGLGLGFGGLTQLTNFRITRRKQAIR